MTKQIADAESSQRDVEADAESSQRDVEAKLSQRIEEERKSTLAKQPFALGRDPKNSGKPNHCKAIHYCLLWTVSESR